MTLLKLEADTAVPRDFPGSSAIAVTEGGRERFAAIVLVCVLCCVQRLSVQCLEEQEEKHLETN